MTCLHAPHPGGVAEGRGVRRQCQGKPEEKVWGIQLEKRQNFWWFRESILPCSLQLLGSPGIPAHGCSTLVPALCSHSLCFSCLHMSFPLCTLASVSKYLCEDPISNKVTFWDTREEDLPCAFGSNTICISFPELQSTTDWELNSRHSPSAERLKVWDQGLSRAAFLRGLSPQV